MSLYKPNSSLIGICVSKTKPGLFSQVKERLQRYPGDATILRFYIQDVNWRNRKVKGVCLEKINGQINEKQGIFPFPDVIYLQCPVDRMVAKKMEQVIGRKVFNSFPFDKWKGLDFIKNDNILHHHLPDTQQLKNQTDLEQFLLKYEDVFLKPIHGHSSKGIIRVKLHRKGNVEVTYQKEYQTFRKELESPKKLWKFIPHLFSATPYLMQKSIQTVQWKGRPTDIRLNINKNETGEWGVSALFTRYALNGSHIGSGRGIQYMPLDMKRFLNDMFPDDKVKVEDTEKAIVDLGFNICRAFDKSEQHMADLGIDLGLDENWHLWIFEVNSLPFPFAEPIMDHSLTRPLEYAHYLLSN